MKQNTVQKTSKKRAGSGKFVASIRNLLCFFPDSSSLKWDKIKDESSGEYVTKVNISPTAFIKNIDPHNGNVTVVKKRFWEDHETEFIATLKVSKNFELITKLDNTLPRDAKWLGLRR